MSTLRVMRAARGLTQGELAKLARLRRETVCRAETGEVRPTPESAKRLAAALGVSAEELFPTNPIDPIEVARWLAAGPGIRAELEAAVETLDSLQNNLQTVLTYLNERDKVTT